MSGYDESAMRMYAMRVRILRGKMSAHNALIDGEVAVVKVVSGADPQPRANSAGDLLSST